MRLEIGPGKRRLGPEWRTLNIVGDADFKHDAARLPYPLPAESCEIILASHVLEHLPWYQTVDILKEWRRLLTTEGVLEVWVPDFAKIVAAYQANELVELDPWRRHNPNLDPMRWVNGRLFNYAGHPNHPARPGQPDQNWHRATFDAPHLLRCLEQAGFGHVTKLEEVRGEGRQHGRRGRKPGWIELGLAARK